MQNLRSCKNSKTKDISELGGQNTLLMAILDKRDMTNIGSNQLHMMIIERSMLVKVEENQDLVTFVVCPIQNLQAIYQQQQQSGQTIGHHDLQGICYYSVNYQQIAKFISALYFSLSQCKYIMLF